MQMDMRGRGTLGNLEARQYVADDRILKKLILLYCS